MMATFPKAHGGVRLFILSIEVLGQKEGLDMPTYMHKIDCLLKDYSTATSVLYKFKVSGESKILSVIRASNVIGLERTVSGLWRLGSVLVECVPIIAFEHFAHSINCHDHLTAPNPGILSKEGLYWLQFDISHSGKSTDELISLWRSEAEVILTARHKEGTSIELYKVVAQRKVHVFINADNPEHIDMLSYKLPMMKENGANVQVTCRALQFLDDHCARFGTEHM